ncbi:unnamed protein product [Cylicostephanus goldi]|uniref:Uncharacterized protein n=1 Tax=Cylicostephanus goldi TaxID=71465 RepID=A0A3P7R2N4_CYLGO|nr:unnamed protein product [Cylicostephanus goldi]
MSWSFSTKLERNERMTALFPDLNCHPHYHQRPVLHVISNMMANNYAWSSISFSWQSLLRAKE